MPEARLAFAPFAAQVAFFRRKVNVPSAHWDDLERADHAHGFMVAGLARADVLEDLRRAIDDAIARGETLADFRARFENIVERRWEGWTGSGSDAGRAWRTRIIYRTNLRTSYMAGRWEQLREFPYLKYQHNTVENPRHEHQAWDGRIIAADDPWWETHYPPNGWGCRCTVTGVSAQRLRALRGDAGADGPPSASAGDPPPEWAYHVGKAARSLPAAAAFGEKLMALPASWRDIALADAQRRAGDLLIALAAAVQTAFAARGTTGPYAMQALPLGFLRPGTVAGLIRHDLPLPTTAMLGASGRDLRHALDVAKRDADLVRDALVDFAEWSTAADTIVLWDSDQDSASPRPALVYARPVPDGRFVKLIFRPNHVPKQVREMRRAGVAANWLRTGGVVTRANLRDRRYILLEGQL